jgi:hypothetical protein
MLLDGVIGLVCGGCRSLNLHFSRGLCKQCLQQVAALLLSEQGTNSWRNLFEWRHGRCDSFHDTHQVATVFGVEHPHFSGLHLEELCLEVKRTIVVHVQADIAVLVRDAGFDRGLTMVVLTVSRNTGSCAKSPASMNWNNVSSRTIEPMKRFIWARLDLVAKRQRFELLVDVGAAYFMAIDHCENLIIARSRIGYAEDDCCNGNDGRSPGCAKRFCHAIH